MSLAALDRAFKAWIATAPTGVSEINAVINAVGIAFGQHLVDSAGLKWVIASGGHGSDLAVYGCPGAGDVLVYPANLVPQRWERRETDFLKTTYREMSSRIISVTSDSGRSSRPWWRCW